jgi:hypothetical protein
MTASTSTASKTHLGQSTKIINDQKVLKFRDEKIQMLTNSSQNKTTFKTSIELDKP